MNEKIIEVLPVHFNVPNHYLPLDEFIETARDVEEILNELNFKFFEGKLNIQILVLPSEDGTFLKRIGFLLLGSATLAWTFLGSDVGKGFVKGLTGHEPAYWAEQAGEGAKELLILKESTKGFLEKDNQTLNQAGITMIEFPSAFKARNDFYSMCLRSEDVKGVEFNKSGKFDIGRGKFSDYFKAEEDKVNIVTTKFINRIHKLIVVAPVISEGSYAQWKARDFETSAHFKFHLKDDGFLQGVLLGKYPFKESKNEDVITVCIEYKIEETNGVEHVCERNAVKIYQFNAIKIAEIPKDISFMLPDEWVRYGEKKKIIEEKNQIALNFDEGYGKKK